MQNHQHDPLQPQAHDPNPEPPSSDPTIILTMPNGRERSISVADLKLLPSVSVHDCYIVSTGHGTSGPFTFTGISIEQFSISFIPEQWTQLEVVSADNFGNRIWRHEVELSEQKKPILLAYEIDGRPLSRKEGLVRLIVPSETDDALRQVKWVHRIQARP